MSGHRSNAATSAASKIIETSSAFWRTNLALSNDCWSPSTKHCENPSRSLMAHSSAKLRRGESNLRHKVLGTPEGFHQTPAQQKRLGGRDLLLQIDTGSRLWFQGLASQFRKA